MWLHPPFFSMVDLHSGQSCVLMDSQLNVSLSSSHFFSHALTPSQLAGACASWRQRVQKACPAPHVAKPSLLPPAVSTASAQPATGHHTVVRLSSTKLLRRKVVYLAAVSALHSRRSSSSGTRSPHLCAGHRMAVSPSSTLSAR